MAYEKLEDVLNRALIQASEGKGNERHAHSLSGGVVPFHEQPMQQIADMEGPGFLTGQAIKKIRESKGLPTKEQRTKELLGAINYIAGAIIYIEKQGDSE